MLQYRQAVDYKLRLLPDCSSSHMVASSQSSSANKDRTAQREYKHTRGNQSAGEGVAAGTIGLVLQQLSSAGAYIQTRQKACLRQRPVHSTRSDTCGHRPTIRQLKEVRAPLITFWLHHMERFDTGARAVPSGSWTQSGNVAIEHDVEHRQPELRSVGQPCIE